MLENLTGVPKMVTQPAQHQAFPLKALTTPKPEGSVSRRKTIVQTPDKGPCGKKRWRRFSCIRGVLKVLSYKEFNFRLSQSREEKMAALTSDTAGQLRACPSAPRTTLLLHKMLINA